MPATYLCKLFHATLDFIASLIPRCLDGKYKVVFSQLVQSEHQMRLVFDLKSVDCYTSLGIARNTVDDDSSSRHDLLFVKRWGEQKLVT